MAECIEREKAIDFIIQYTPNFSGQTTISCVVRALKEVPTEDMVKVVRCSNCVKYEPDIIADGVGWCDKFECGMCDNNFCSYGKLKGGENDA